MQSLSSSPQNITLILQKGYSSEEFVNYTMTLHNHISQRALCNDNVTGPHKYIRMDHGPAGYYVLEGLKEAPKLFLQKKKRKKEKEVCFVWQ